MSQSEKLPIEFLQPRQTQRITAVLGTATTLIYEEPVRPFLSSGVSRDVHLAQTEMGVSGAPVPAPDLPLQRRREGRLGLGRKLTALSVPYDERRHPLLPPPSLLSRP